MDRAGRFFEMRATQALTKLTKGGRDRASDSFVSGQVAGVSEIPGALRGSLGWMWMSIRGAHAGLLDRDEVEPTEVFQHRRGAADGLGVVQVRPALAVHVAVLEGARQRAGLDPLGEGGGRFQVGRRRAVIDAAGVRFQEVTPRDRQLAAERSDTGPTPAPSATSIRWNNWASDGIRLPVLRQVAFDQGAFARAP